jgi:predicted nucleotidyltransferase
MVLISAGRLSNIEKIRQGVYARLLGSLTYELFRRISRLRSVVLYGSAARGLAHSDSDIDLLVIFESKASFGERIELLTEVESAERVEGELTWLYKHGIDTHISFLPMNPEEVKASPPILLDIFEDGVVLLDDGFFCSAAERFKAHLRRLGAKRIFISPQEWYWDLKPTIKFGEVVAI